MSEFHERLVAADPAAGPSYAHHDPESMVSRIVARNPVRRRNVLRDFQLKMAGAVTMATVLTVGGIAALDAAVPGLPILALASAHAKASTPGAASKDGVGTFSTIMRVYEQYNFTAGSGLSANASTGNAYHLALPTSGSAEASRIASIFSVSGPPVNTNGDSTNWTVTDPSGPSVSYDHYGGVPIWYYQSASTASFAPSPSAGADSGIEAVPAQAMPNRAVVESDVKGYLSRLGYGYQLSSPQFSSSVGTTAGPDQVTTTTNWATVDYGVLVDGTRTDQSVRFTFDASNQLVSASGPAFSADAPVNYPLQSPVAGVAVLNAQQRSYFTSSGAPSGAPSGTGGTVAPTGSGPVTQDATNPSSVSSGTSTGTVPSPGPTDTTTTTGPPIVDVTLDSVDVTLQSYTLTDGSVWLLPIYTYTGNVTPSHGTSYHGTWSTIAVDPAFVQVAVVTSPILY